MADLAEEVGMNTCGTCRFFGKVREFERWDNGADDSWVEIPAYHVCGLLQHLNGSDHFSDLPTQPAGVIDGSGYYAALCVREDFGCNQWQAAAISAPATPAP